MRYSLISQTIFTILALCVSSINAQTLHKASPTLQAEAAAGGEFTVIVELEQPNLPLRAVEHNSPYAPAQALLATDLDSAGVDVRYNFGIVPFSIVQTDAKGLAALNEHPLVRSLASDVIVEAQMAESLGAINALDIATTTGLTGAGVTVAIIDTGIDTDHQDLAGKVVDQRTFLDQGTTVLTTGEDDHGHGTRVAGVIAAEGIFQHQGVAPNVDLLSVKVLDEQARGFMSDAARGVEWTVLQLGKRPGLSIINLSFGDTTGSVDCPCDTTPEYQLIRRMALLAANNNVLVVAASGNQGFTDRMAAPACLVSVTSVGAVYDAPQIQAPDSGLYSQQPGYEGYASCADGAVPTHTMTCFTNRNNCLDYLAPGYTLLTPTVGGTVSTQAWGTSLAAAHISGAMALVREKTGERSSIGFTNFYLKNTAQNVIDPITLDSFPRIDTLAAVQIAPTPTPVAVPPTFPDIFIGDLENGAASNDFNFPDALNLDVLDTATSISLLSWSYDGSNTYVLNGVPALTGVEDPMAPPLAKRIDLLDLDLGNPGQDLLPHTVTVRNDILSPLSGTPPFAEPAINGVLTTYTLPITLYATDGVALGSFVFLTYTQNNDGDSLTKPLADEADFDYLGNAADRTGWLGAVLSGNGTVGEVSGLCMNAPLTGDNVIGWASPENYVALMDQSVYRMRVRAFTSQVATNAIPFWEIVYNNFYLAGQGNNYGGEVWFYDAAGGAQGIGRGQGREEFEAWTTPNAVLTEQWRGIVDPASSAFDASIDPFNDINLTYRILDLDAANLGSDIDAGPICIETLDVDSVLIPNLALNNLYSPPLNSLTHAAQAFGQEAFGTVAQIDDPTATAVYQLASSGTGARKTLLPFDVLEPDQNLALYPVSWTANTLYMGQSNIRSNVNSGALPEGNDPIDVIINGFNTPQVELGAIHVTTLGSPGNMFFAGSPRLPATTSGVAQPYVGFFYGHNATVNNFPGLVQTRTFIDLFNIDSLRGSGNGLDGLAIETMTVDSVNTGGFY